MGGECNDVLHRWAAISDLTDSGALLVRPDRIIAWNCPVRPADPTSALRAAMMTATGRGRPDASADPETLAATTR